MNPNENHTPDSTLVQKIDNLIERHQPTGIPAADDLASTIPQANPDFQQHLEDRLLAQIQVSSTGEAKLAVHTISKAAVSRPRRFYIPLTLAVAMLAVALVGSLLVSLSGKPSNMNLALLGTQTATFTPEHMVNVVVAKQELPRGYQFPSSVDEISKVVDYFPWPESAVPPGALVEAENGLEQLAGRVLRSNVYREQIIVTSLLAADPEHTLVPAVVSGILFLDQSRVAIALPAHLLTGISDAVQVGKEVDISALVTFVGGKNSDSEVKLQKIVRNATVLRIGDYLPTPTTPPDIITLAVLPDEAETLAWLVEKETPMTLELLVKTVTSEWQDTRSLILIPVQQLISPVGTGIQAGDHVSITAQFLFVNTDENGSFQVIPTKPPVIVIPPTPDTPITVIPPTSHSSPTLVSQVVVNDAEIMSINSYDNTVTVAVSPQEENTLRWLLDAKIPLILGNEQPDYLSTIAPPEIGGT